MILILGKMRRRMMNEKKFVSLARFYGEDVSRRNSWFKNFFVRRKLSGHGEFGKIL